MGEQPQDNKIGTNSIGLIAGGDVHLSDVTGQIAIGEYINQSMIKEPSGEALDKLIAFLEQKRKEAFNLKILSSYNPSALPYFDPRLKKLIPANRVEELNKALMYLQDHRIFLFTGIGGVGKTTLARALVEVRPANVPLPFWFDFGHNKDAKLGDILEKLAAYMNCPDIAKFREEKREPEKKDIDNLTDKLQAGNPVWLIFDNIETVLEDVYFQNEDIDMFFTCLRNSSHQTKIIITSRVSPMLKNGENLIDVIEEEKQDVKGLKINFAVEYLVKNGLGNLEPDKLEELAKGVDGHPLALQLLVGLVKKFGASDALKNLARYKRLKKDTIKKTRELFEKLAGDEKELLERVSVYRQAEIMDAIEVMFTDKTPIEAVDNLIDKSLLETDHRDKYWLHPLVQEFS
ncbi:MAG TPA: NB-ARC domain-containing protein, partial [Ignavibacteria bacterium]